MELTMVDSRPFMGWICDHQWAWSAAGLDAGVGLAGSSRYWDELMELTMVNSACKLGKSVATSDPSLQRICTLDWDWQQAQKCSSQGKSIRSQKHGKIEVETESGKGQNRTRWKQQNKNKQNEVNTTKVKVKQNSRRKNEPLKS